jgi:chromosome partitioning protein
MSGKKNKAHVVCLSNHKGGVAKTTSACNLGAGLSMRGKKVLLIDMDPQANLSMCFGLRDSQDTIYKVLISDLKAKDAVFTIQRNLDIIPSSLDLAGAEIELSSEQGREMILQEELESVIYDYDYIIIDCGPNLGLLTTNSLTVADEVIVPVEASYFSIKGLQKLTSIIKKIQKRLNPSLKSIRILITQFDSRKTIQKDIAREIEKHYPNELFKTRIRSNVTLAEAPTKGVDIFRYDPNSRGAEDYNSLCDEVLSLETVEV